MAHRPAFPLHSTMTAAPSNPPSSPFAALQAEVFTNEGTGTLVVADVHALAPAEIAAATP